MITEEQDTANQIRAYQVEQLYARLPMVARVTFIVITLLVIIQWPVIDHSTLLVWWGIMVLITTSRWLLVLQYRQSISASASVNIEHWATRFLMGTICSGLAWGAAGFFLFPEESFVHQVVLILIIAGMASAGVTTLASVKENVIVFLCLMLIPPVLRLFFIGTRIYLAIGGLIILYLIGIILSARYMNNTFLEIFTLRINSMQQAAKLRESEERYRDLFENATDLIQSTTPGGHFIYVNQAWRETLGYSKNEVPEMTFSDIIHPDSRTHCLEIFHRLISGEKVGKVETVFVSKSGKKVIVEGSVSCRYKEGKPLSTRGIFRDITERNRAQEKIKASLEEKEVLLKEIHHRVKNNLQTISSLLNLQSGYIKDKNALDVLKNSQERVYAMALIHEKLYESRDLSKIDFREYIHSLVTHLFNSYSLKAGQIQLKKQIEDVVLDIETSIPLGLIINELVSNSLKHAFPSGKKGNLQVNLKKSEDEKYDYILIVGDNGVGFPDSLDFQGSNSLGMMLVNSLVKRLKGVINLDREDGAKFTVKFKKLYYKKRV